MISLPRQGETHEQWKERIINLSRKALEASLEPREEIKMLMSAKDKQELFKDKDKVSYKEVREFYRNKERKGK